MYLRPTFPYPQRSDSLLQRLNLPPREGNRLPSPVPRVTMAFPLWRDRSRWPLFSHRRRFFFGRSSRLRPPLEAACPLFYCVRNFFGTTCAYSLFQKGTRDSFRDRPSPPEGAAFSCRFLEPSPSSRFFCGEIGRSPAELLLSWDFPLPRARPPL